MIYGDSGIVRRNAKKSPEAVERLNFPHPLRERRAPEEGEKKLGKRKEEREKGRQRKNNLLLP